MESHVLNSYHQARYRTIGHKIMRAKSDSLSSEGSNQNSPEYAQIALQRAPSIAQSEDSNGEDWCQNQTINTTRSSQDTSSDDESSDGQDDIEENLVVKEKTDDEDVDDNLVIQEINVDDSDENIDVDDDDVHEVTVPVRHNGFHNVRESNPEDNSLVEGHDYDVITVYEVNPDLDLIEASSDDDSNQTDFAVTEKNFDEGEYLNPEDSLKYTNHGPQHAPENGIDLNLYTPVISNVDEYFIKEKDLLEVDGPVVKDVDEYFIKDKGKKVSSIVPNIDDFFIKHRLPEEESTTFHIPETLPNVDKFLVIEKNIKNENVKNVIPEEVLQKEDIPLEDAAQDEPESKLDVSINESDLEVLPNIEDLKRYLLEEMTYSKFKNIQKSCSLPHSPMHASNLCMDVDDAKTCLSFEDLNLDLSDLAFDNDKDKSDNANKSDDVPRTLTDEDVNSFLITNKPETKSEKHYDNLNPQEMEIEDTIESNITDIPLVNDSFRKLTPTPLPSVIPTSKVLDFCVEKTPSPTRKVFRKEKATPIKVVEPPRKVKVVPLLNPQFKSGEVIDVKPISVVKPIVPFMVKPVIPVVKPIAVKLVAPKTIITKPVIAESKVALPDLDDFVDVESCNDTVIPVLAANNLSSLLEQFEATEKLNKTKKPLRIAPVEELKKLNKSLTNGMRIQDAGVQLKNNKMRQILMPTTINTAVRRSPSPVHSDHDYCSSKERHSLPNLKGGQSLLKPEVLSSNSRILSSRHRSCKNKKVVYNLSSDDESDKKETKNKKVISDSELKKKTSVKPAAKPPAQSNCRKKLSPTHSVNEVVRSSSLKSNSSVINKCASKASDTPCSQNSNGSIKLTIKNKSEVILNCDHKDSQIKFNDNVEKCKVSSSVSDVPNLKEIKQEKHIKHEEIPIKDLGKHVKEEEKHVKEVEKNIKEVVRIKNIHSVEADAVKVKEESRPKDEKKDEHFYTALFSNKQDVKLPHTMPIKKESNAFEEELNKANEIKKEEPQKKKKLNLQEYKLRRGGNSNNSSTAVSPESIFPDMPLPLNSEKTVKPVILTLPNDLINKGNNETPKKFYDPIREASRKIVANAKKQKAEALRKRDEDIVMSKIPKIHNLQLQPLISDAEMLKIVGLTQPEPVPAPVIEKPQLPADYDEIILVSVGTNTDEDIIKQLHEAELKMIEKIKKKTEKFLSPPIDPKSRINFKINKSENVLKQNVFDLKKDKRHEDKKHTESKIDKERFKDITATLKSVGKQVDTKISSNSLFASIQDVVMKKAPENEQSEKEKRHSKPKSPVEKREIFKFGRATIVREYDVKADHGEDKIILHLGKQRNKPKSTNINIQTDPVSENTESKAETIAKEKSSVNRRRNDSDMSMSSEGSPARVNDKPKEDKVVKPARPEKRSLSKEKRSRSKDRYEAKHRRRSRSLSRSRRRRRSPSRSRSKSRGRFRRYRKSERSDSPYKRKRRTRSRSRSYHKRRSLSRRSPSIKRNNRSISRQRTSKSPVAKKARPSPQSTDRKSVKSMTPPLRKPTVSESSDSSTSSSSSSSSDSSSSSSSSSEKSRRSSSPYKLEAYRMKSYRGFSPEDRENNTPVEERRIVFVGKLEKDITKSTLRSQFSKFGHILEVRLHSKEDGTRYGFVTYQRPRDAWSAVEAASSFPQYDVGFGGRRAFCRQSYADLDGLEATYTESAFHGAGAGAGESAGAGPGARRAPAPPSFEQMLRDMRTQLSQRKHDAQRDTHP